MPPEIILMQICGLGFAVVQAAALIVFGIFAQRYIRFHSGRIRHGSRSLLLLSLFDIDDYYECRQIAKEVGHEPIWLLWFEWLEFIAIALFVAMPIMWAVIYGL